VQHPHPSASKVGGAEPSTQLEDAEAVVQEKEQPKAEAVAESVGVSATNDKQTTMETSVPEVDTANHEEDKPEVPEARAKDGEVENTKQEEKTSEDHGGEELVEGQEDDVMY
jgi:hypothetical protein